MVTQALVVVEPFGLGSDKRDAYTSSLASSYWEPAHHGYARHVRDRDRRDDDDRDEREDRNDRGGRLTMTASAPSVLAVSGRTNLSGHRKTMCFPEDDTIDFYESLEGMRVEANNPLAISGTSQLR